MTEHRIDTGSPEERVKAKWPDARVKQLTLSHFRIESGYGWAHLGFGRSPSEAWADAASRLEDSK